MDKLRIRGGKRLDGKIIVGGAKNSGLKLMAASLLTPEKVTLDNVPYLADITTMAKLVVQHGAHLTLRDTSPATRLERDAPQHYSREISLYAPKITSVTAPYDLVRTMRASIVVLGPLLAREGRAKVSLPGGCAIGARPVDMHLKAMEQLGAKIELSEGYVIATAPKGGLKGAEIHFDKVSVGATENTLMAATLAHGTTVIHNAAREPEIGDLVDMLRSMGAAIEGKDTSTLTVKGATSLRGCTHRVIPDRIETGTYLCAVAAAGGSVELLDTRPETLTSTVDLLRSVGLRIDINGSTIHVSHDGAPLNACNVNTAPHPDFPTDMQAQLMAALTRAKGNSTLCETIFENRFMHVPELNRMGADIRIEGHCATIHGVAALKGAPVMATDLRASVSLVIAALAAEGETIVNRIYHLDRGYERLEEKLSSCGADIRRVA